MPGLFQMQNQNPQQQQAANPAPAQQQGGYVSIVNQRMGGGSMGGLGAGLGAGLGGFGPMQGGYGGMGGMPFNVSGYGGMEAGLGGMGGYGGDMGGFGGFGFNPMMGGYGGFGGFNPMMGGFGGYGGFNPMMAMGLGAFGGYGFNPMMMGGYGGFGGFGGFNPMMGGYGQFGGMGRYGGAINDDLYALGPSNDQAARQQMALSQYRSNPNSFNNPAPTFDFSGQDVLRQQMSLEQQRQRGMGQPQAGINPVFMSRSPQDMQNYAREESARNEINRQLNEQFTRDKSAGMSLMDIAKAQGKLSNQLHSQYGLKAHQLGPN